MAITLNLKKDELLTDYSVGMLKDFYLRDDEKSPQHGYARAAEAWATYEGETDWDLAQRLYDYVSNKWFMFASPVLSNTPLKLWLPHFHHAFLKMLGLKFSIELRLSK